MPTHQELDERSLALHRLIAEKIRRDPALFDRVLQTLARWRAAASEASQPYLQAWEVLAREGMDVCLRVAEEDSERSAALRQASPFAGLLSNAERFAFLKTWRRDRAPR